MSELWRHPHEAGDREHGDNSVRLRMPLHAEFFPDRANDSMTLRIRRDPGRHLDADSFAHTVRLSPRTRHGAETIDHAPASLPRQSGRASQRGGIPQGPRSNDHSSHGGIHSRLQRCKPTLPQKSIEPSPFGDFGRTDLGIITLHIANQVGPPRNLFKIIQENPIAHPWFDEGQFHPLTGKGKSASSNHSNDSGRTGIQIGASK